LAPEFSMEVGFRHDPRRVRYQHDEEVEGLAREVDGLVAAAEMPPAFIEDKSVEPHHGRRAHDADYIGEIRGILRVPRISPKPSKTHPPSAPDAAVERHICGHSWWQQAWL